MGTTTDVATRRYAHVARHLGQDVHVFEKDPDWGARTWYGRLTAIYQYPHDETATGRVPHIVLTITDEGYCTYVADAVDPVTRGDRIAIALRNIIAVSSTYEATDLDWDGDTGGD